MQKVGIVGVGLVGGSRASTIKVRAAYAVYGTD